MGLTDTGPQQNAPGRGHAAPHGGEEPPKIADRLSRATFLVSIFVLGSVYGMVADRYALFPYPAVNAAWIQVTALKTRVFERDKSIALPDRPAYEVGPDAPAVADGLLLVVGMGEDLVNFARVVDRNGNVVHEWRPNWFEIWPDDGYVPADRRPQSLPGALVHGAEIAPDGDLIVNFDVLTTVRLDPCGNVRWKLPNFGHHSVFITDEGEIWVSAERVPEGAREETDEAHPYARDFTIQKLSPGGEILFERSVIDILAENGLAGLVQIIRPHWNENNTLHTNDVEIFPRTLAPGFFGPGDILISMREINTLMVLDPTGRKVKFAYTGAMVRQHDPDFASGNTITVFDNHHTEGSVPADEPDRSRILEITAPAGTVREVFRGPAYFTHNMGKHQVLPNGNLLVTVSQQGQALEIAPDGRLAWQFENDLGDGMRGLLTEVDLLPPAMDAAFFQALRAGCGAAR
jgi:hypothetical protein